MKQPFRITVEQYDYKFTYELGTSNIDLEAYHEALLSISRTMGWSEKQLKYIGLIDETD